ncbi:MAG TPA: hypothetical protein V6C76_16700 [Drouetiella sp.]
MYELLVKLLGSKLNGIEYANLVAAIGNPSIVYRIPIDETETLEMFEFFDYGIGVSYSSRAEMFKAVGCEYVSGSKLRQIKPFPSSGPFGISHSDGKREVQNKFATAPVSTRKLKSYTRITYKVGAHTVECLFDGKGTVLKSFSVCLTERKSRLKSH